LVGGAVTRSRFLLVVRSRKSKRRRQVGNWVGGAGFEARFLLVAFCGHQTAIMRRFLVTKPGFRHSRTLKGAWGDT
jgi:hypothetical protein